MTRPNLTRWQQFGAGHVRTLRTPYTDAEVRPLETGRWVWRLSGLSLPGEDAPVLEYGFADDEAEAMDEADKALARRGGADAG